MVKMLLGYVILAFIFHKVREMFENIWKTSENPCAFGYYVIIKTKYYIYKQKLL